MARAAVVVLRSLRAQSEQKEKALDLCIPSIACPLPVPLAAPLGYYDYDSSPSLGDPAADTTTTNYNYTVSATVLAFEIPGLGHVMQRQGGDCCSGAALWAMAHILALVEEKVSKHQAFVLKQHGATCIVAAVSNDLHCSGWPLCSVADLALDLMTSLADVELTLTSDGPLRPRFGIHTGQAIGYIGVGSPVRYCVVGDVVSSALCCQRLSAPNCIRLTWAAYCALLRLGHYICIESDANSTEDSATTPPDGGPALYLAGKRTSQDEGLLHRVTTTTTTTTKQHPAAHWIFHYV